MGNNSGNGFGFNIGGGGGGGGTNTNLGNDNLTADNTARTYKVASGGTITFQTNAGVNTAQMNDSGALVIGGASPYTMPTARASAQYQVLAATNGTGALSFKQGKIPGAAFMFSSGSIGTYDAANYCIPKKNGRSYVGKCIYHT